jgi:hypothetical protein
MGMAKARQEAADRLVELQGDRARLGRGPARRRASTTADRCTLSGRDRSSAVRQVAVSPCRARRSPNARPLRR